MDGYEQSNFLPSTKMKGASVSLIGDADSAPPCSRSSSASASSTRRRRPSSCVERARLILTRQISSFTSNLDLLDIYLSSKVRALGPIDRADETRTSTSSATRAT